MILRLLADADLNGSIVSGAIRRNAELDFKRAENVPLEGLDDEVVLDVAAKDRRVLVSHDVSTMPDHLREYPRRRVSPGLVLVPQNLSIGEAIENILIKKPVWATNAHEFKRIDKGRQNGYLCEFVFIRGLQGFCGFSDHVRCKFC